MLAIQNFFAVAAAGAERLDLPEGKTVFDEGSKADGLYLIAAGKVMIAKGVEPGQRHQRTLATLGSGEFFGELSLLLDEPRVASARTVENTTLYRIGRDRFHELRAQHDPAACAVVYNLALGLCTRLRQVDNSLVGLVESSERKGSIPAADLKDMRARLFTTGLAI